MPKADVVIIGAGSGGYVAALRLARYGKKVVLVEKDRVGGVCLLRGCIPSKAMVYASEVYRLANSSQHIGIVGEISLDFVKLHEWKEEVIDKIVGGIEGQCKRLGVEVMVGEAKITSPTTVQVGSETIETEHIIVATGSTPRSIPGFEFDGQSILSSKEILALIELPTSLCVIGGGAIGLEMGTFFAKLGTKVTIVELQERILPFIDKDVTNVVVKSLKELGIVVHTGTTALRYEKSGDKLTVWLKTADGEEKQEFDKVLVAVGRSPNSKGFGLEELGVNVDAGGFVVVDETMRASVPNIYAIGDVAGQPMLAHKASYEGCIAADAIASKQLTFASQTPIAIFTDPEIGMVGMTEDKAKLKGLEIVCKRFYFAALGRALAKHDPRGFVKFVVSARTQRLLGVQIVGNEASSLISECVLAIENGMTVKELATIIHPHPTMSEAIGELARALQE